MKKVKKTEKDWRKELSDKEFKVLREKATEMPFTGKLLYNKENGVYSCAACGNELFHSTAKYDSMSGWPSFYEPLKENSVEFKEDSTLGLKRVEVVCKKCGGHLGHVFDDGPMPTGKRYCVNSASLQFKRNEEGKT